MKIAVVLVFVVAAFAAFPALYAVAAVTPTLTIVPEVPERAVPKSFLDFFHHYNRLVNIWWEKEGKARTSSSWEVIVTPTDTERPRVKLAVNGLAAIDISVIGIKKCEGNIPILIIRVPPHRQTYPLVAAQMAVERTKDILTGREKRPRRAAK